MSEISWWFAVGISPFVIWLGFCFLVMLLKPVDEAERIIAVSGRWSPLRLRRVPDEDTQRDEMSVSTLLSRAGSTGRG